MVSCYLELVGRRSVYLNEECQKRTKQSMHLVVPVLPLLYVPIHLSSAVCTMLGTTIDEINKIERVTRMHANNAHLSPVKCILDNEYL